jgi:hypothetical protein
LAGSFLRALLAGKGSGLGQKRLGVFVWFRSRADVQQALARAAVVMEAMSLYPGKTLVLCDVDCVIRGDIELVRFGPPEKYPVNCPYARRPAVTWLCGRSRTDMRLCLRLLPENQGLQARIRQRPPRSPNLWRPLS